MLTGIIGDKEEKHVGKGSHKDEAKTDKVRILHVITGHSCCFEFFIPLFTADYF
jgi:hypothetical protein